MLGVLGVFGVVWAQGVRGVGMGGVTLPGPAASAANPAFTAVPAKFGGGGFQLPLGLLGLLLPDRSPLYYFLSPDTFYSSFDGLSAFDQLTHLDQLLINPERSPDEVVLEVGGGGVWLTDGQGHPLRLRIAEAANRSSPLGAGYRLGQGFSAGVGLFSEVQGPTLSPNAALEAALASGTLEPNTTYAISASGLTKYGLGAGVAYATPLPALPDLTGTLYVGARMQGFVGLARADVTGTFSVQTDAQGKVDTQTAATSTRAFYSLLGEGYGFGGGLDVGVAWTSETAVLGLGVRNLLAYERWEGKEYVANENGTTTQPKTLETFGARPAVFVNAAGYVGADEGTRLLLAGDLAYDGGVSGHLGVEYPLPGVALRAGVGYEGGLRLGVGAGFKLGGMGLDLALSSHAGPWSGKPVVGLSASVSF